MERVESALTEGEQERLFSEHIGLARAVAARFSGRGAESEDLFQIASIGLLRAIRTFDAGRGFRFSTYAVPVIVGQIRDYLRENSTVKVSRTIRRNSAALSRAAEELGAGATLLKCAEKAGLSSEDAVLASCALSPTASLDEVGDSAFSAHETGYDRVLDRVALQEGMRTLTREEAALISLRYFRALTQSQTARVLQMTQVQVCRAEKRILQKLKLFLET